MIAAMSAKNQLYLSMVFADGRGDGTGRKSDSTTRIIRYDFHWHILSVQVKVLSIRYLK